MCRRMQRLCVSLSILAVLAGAHTDNRYDQTSIYYTEPTTLMNVSGVNDNGGLHELHGGRIVRGQRLLTRSKSPYLLREDLFIEKDGELVIESGVEIRFGPMIGITVRGIITAEVIIRKNRNRALKSGGHAALEKARLCSRDENKGDRRSRSLSRIADVKPVSCKIKIAWYQLTASIRDSSLG